MTKIQLAAACVFLGILAYLRLFYIPHSHQALKWQCWKYLALESVGMVGPEYLGPLHLFVDNHNLLPEDPFLSINCEKQLFSHMGKFLKNFNFIMFHWP